MYWPHTVLYIYNVPMYSVYSCHVAATSAASRQSVSSRQFVSLIWPPIIIYAPLPLCRACPSPILAQRPVAVRGAQETSWSRHGVKTSPPSALRFLILDTPYYIHINISRREQRESEEERENRKRERHFLDTSMYIYTAYSRSIYICMLFYLFYLSLYLSIII